VLIRDVLWVVPYFANPLYCRSEIHVLGLSGFFWRKLSRGRLLVIYSKHVRNSILEVCGYFGGYIDCWNIFLDIKGRHSAKC
jgi:hypothetical protein